MADVHSCSQTLNLSGLSYLQSHDLEGLLSDDEQPSPLEELILNNTGVGDDAAPYISCCSSLRVLELGSTKFTSKKCISRLMQQYTNCHCVGDGLFTILDGCPKIERLNLTSCRGIKIAERRNFFQVKYRTPASA